MLEYYIYAKEIDASHRAVVCNALATLTYSHRQVRLGNSH